MLWMGDSRDSVCAGDNLPIRWIITTHKLLSVLFCFWLAVWAMTPASWVVLAMVIVHALVWHYREHHFPDKNWSRTLSYPGSLVFWLAGLFPHWVLFWNASYQKMPWWVNIIPVGVWLYGMFLNTYADAYKARQKEAGFKGLIMSGLWNTSRNPNYRYELFAFSGYALMVSSPLTFLVNSLVMLWILFIVMGPSLAQKERHMHEKYRDQWKIYVRNTPIL